MQSNSESPIIIAMTGASGAAYGLRLLECVLAAKRPVYFMLSKAAQMVLATETELDIPSTPRDIEAWLSDRYQADEGQLSVFGREQWMAPVASGSHTAAHMVVCPCTTGTLSAIAQGSSDNLIERAADVMLKEKRGLVLVVRETPFSTIHLENMLRLAQAGATILPANPGFYHQPRNIDDLVDFIVARILDHIDVSHSLLPRWGSDDNEV